MRDYEGKAHGGKVRISYQWYEYVKTEVLTTQSLFHRP